MLPRGFRVIIDFFQEVAADPNYKNSEDLLVDEQVEEEEEKLERTTEEVDPDAWWKPLVANPDGEDGNKEFKLRLYEGFQTRTVKEDEEIDDGK